MTLDPNDMRTYPVQAFTLGVTAAVGVADYLLTQQIQEVEENLGVYQEKAYPLGLQIEKVDGTDVESADSE